MGIGTPRLALPVVLAGLMAGLLSRRLRDPRGEAGLVGLRVGAGEGRVTSPPDPASRQAAEEAPQAMADSRPTALAAPALDLSRRAMHTSGLVDSRRRVVVVLTLSPKTKSFEAQSSTITSITRTLRDEAAATAARR